MFSQSCLSRNRSQRPYGFTLIELLLVIAIIGILISLTIPAVQSARDAARRLSCSNNLRQLALGALQYEATYRKLPPSFIDLQNAGQAKHNVLAVLLPYIEQLNLAERYQFDCEWYRFGPYTSASGNISESENCAIAGEHIPIFLCPASPSTGKATINTALYSGTFGTADYSVCNKVLPKSQAGIYIEDRYTLNDDSLDHGSMLRPIRRDKEDQIKDSTLTMAGVTDGLSNTIMLTEDAGRPDYFERDGRARGINTSVYADPYVLEGTAWADHEAEFSIHDECSGRLMNCNNSNEIYSFHYCGSMFAFGDGSAKFLHENLDPLVLLSLLSADGGETVETP